MLGQDLGSVRHKLLILSMTVVHPAGRRKPGVLAHFWMMNGECFRTFLVDPGPGWELAAYWWALGNFLQWQLCLDMEYTDTEL